MARILLGIAVHQSLSHTACCCANVNLCYTACRCALVIECVKEHSPSDVIIYFSCPPSSSGALPCATPARPAGRSLQRWGRREAMPVRWCCAGEGFAALISLKFKKQCFLYWLVLIVICCPQLVCNNTKPALLSPFTSPCHKTRPICLCRRRSHSPF